MAVVVPVLDGSDDGILYLECWRNELQSIGNHVAIDLSTFGRFRSEFLCSLIAHQNGTCVPQILCKEHLASLGAGS